MKFVKTFEKFTGGQTAYHGSPYSFSRFGFTSREGTVKTGVKSKNWGWGIYFTSNRDVARYYADISLADDFYGSGLSIKVDGVELKDKIEKWAEVYQKARNIIRTWGKDKVNDFCRLMRKEFPKLKDYFKPKHITLKYDAKKWLYDAAATAGLNIEDWDSKPSRALLSKLDPEFHSNKYSTTYKSISNKLGGDEEASKYLLELGVDGHVYKGYKGEDNWVIYDVSKLTITNKEEVVELNESNDLKPLETWEILTVTDEQIDKICEFYNYCADNSVLSDIYDDLTEVFASNGVLDTAGHPADINLNGINPTTVKTYVRNMKLMLDQNELVQKQTSRDQSLQERVVKVISELKDFNSAMLYCYNKIKDFKNHDLSIFDTIESCAFDLLHDNDNLYIDKVLKFTSSGNSCSNAYTLYIRLENINIKTLLYRGRQYTHDGLFTALADGTSMNTKQLRQKLETQFERVYLETGDAWLSVMVVI